MKYIYIEDAFQWKLKVISFKCKVNLVRNIQLINGIRNKQRWTTVVLLLW